MTAIFLTPTPLSNFIMQSGGVVGFNIDASGEKYSIVFLAADAIAISELNYGTFTGAGTQPIYKISLQGVDSSGLPDGTVKGGGSPASATFAGSSGANTWVTLDNTYACTRNELLALVVEYSSGTIDGSNFSRFSPTATHTAQRPSTPYTLTHNGTSWTKDTNDGPGIWGYSNGTSKFGNPFKIGTDTISSSVESGARINLNAGYGGTYQISGCSYFRTALPSGATLAISLYDSTQTLLQSSTVIANASANLSGERMQNIYFDEGTLTDLDFGSDYYLVMSVSSSSSGFYSYTTADATSMSAIPLGDDFMYATRSHTYPPASAGAAFSTTSTKRPLMMPIIADITEPTGGGSVVPLLNGGLLT